MTKDGRQFAWELTNCSNKYCWMQIHVKDKIGVHTYTCAAPSTHKGVLVIDGYECGVPLCQKHSLEWENNKMGPLHE